MAPNYFRRSFVYGNIRDFPHMADALAKLDLRELNDHGGFLGTVEMWNRRDELRETMPPKNWEHVAEWGKSPAASYLTRVYTPRVHGFAPLHDAISGVSDRRQILWTRQHEKVSRIPFEAQVVHYTPSAWSTRFSGSTRERIRAQWKAGRDRQRARIRECIRQDLPVVVMGDFNHKGKSLGWFIHGRKVQYVSAPNGIDKFAFINTKSYRWKIDSKTKKVFDLHSDHHGLKITAELHRVR